MIEMEPPNGGESVFVLESQVETMEGRGWKKVSSPFVLDEPQSEVVEDGKS